MKKSMKKSLPKAQLGKVVKQAVKSAKKRMVDTPPYKKADPQRKRLVDYAKWLSENWKDIKDIEKNIKSGRGMMAPAVKRKK